MDGDIKYRIRNEVETHVFPEVDGHEFFACRENERQKQAIKNDSRKVAIKVEENTEDNT